MQGRKVEVTYRPLERLVPYARNARTHNEHQVAQIAASIREFGWTNPVLIDEQGGIVAGHGRVLAARVLGMVEVPCIVLTGLTDVQRRAYVLADNKLALNAGWDAELLALEVEALKGMNFDLEVAGFSAPEVESILSGWAPSGDPENTDPNDDGLQTHVKVRCAQVDADDVRGVIRKALEQSGIAGATLVD